MSKVESKYALKQARKLGASTFSGSPWRYKTVRPESVNPFPSGSAKHTSWEQGWLEAREQFINAGNY